jgi:hypothetical protein
MYKNRLIISLNAGLGKFYIEGYNHAKKTRKIKFSDSKMIDFIRASCEADPTIEIKKIFANAVDTNFGLASIPSSVVNNKQFLLNKWWGMGKGECDLKGDSPLLIQWDNEGNEFWVIGNKWSEYFIKNKSQLINSKWLIYGYGKPDLGENYVKGEYYDLDNKEKLTYNKYSYKFQKRNNKDILVMKLLEQINTDESGKKIKQDVLSEDDLLYDCNINNIRVTKEFSNQFASIKSKWKKSQ